MATPILNSLSKDLAYKLQDPVSLGNANGVRLSAGERLRYILRAYRRLLRMVDLLYPTLIQKIFKSYYVTGTGTTNNAGKIIGLSNIEIFDIYCKEPTDEDYFKALYITPETYFDIETGQNKFYEPDLNTDRYYWTRSGDDILVLPAVTLSYKIIYRDDVAAKVETGGYNGPDDFDIPGEYEDLLLGLACSEAYLDIGQPDLTQAYKADVEAQLNILVTNRQIKDKEDDKDSP